VTSANRNSGFPASSLVLLILLASAVFLPFGYGLDLGPGPNSIRALVWEYIDAPWFSGLRFVRIGQIFESLLYTFPRYLFIIQLFKLYRGHSNQKRTAILGILGALFPGLFSLVLIFGWLQGWTQPPPPVSDHRFPIYVPIPTILILGIVLLWFFPPAGRDKSKAS
jgi:hypothetical protein